MGQSRCGLEPLARTLSEEETVASGKGWGENQDKSDEDHDHNHDYDAGESPLRGLHETRNPLAASRPERNQVPSSSILSQSTSWSVLLSLSSSSLCFHSDFHRHRQAPDHHLQVMVLMIRRLLWRCWCRCSRLQKWCLYLFARLKWLSTASGRRGREGRTGRECDYRGIQSQKSSCVYLYLCISNCVLLLL